MPAAQTAIARGVTRAFKPPSTARAETGIDPTDCETRANPHLVVMVNRGSGSLQPDFSAPSVQQGIIPPSRQTEPSAGRVGAFSCSGAATRWRSAEWGSSLTLSSPFPTRGLSAPANTVDAPQRPRRPLADLALQSFNLPPADRGRTRPPSTPSKAPPARSTRPAPAPERSRPGVENRPGRPRAGRIHRLLLHILLPSAALLIIGWGTRAPAFPPPASEADRGAARSAAVASLHPTPPGSPPASPPLRAVAWPRRPASPVAAASVTASPSTPEPIPAPIRPPTLDVVATAVPSARPEPTGTAVADAACQPPSPRPATTADPVETTAAVNLRSGPSTDCPALDLLQPGTRVVPLGRPISAGGRLWLPVAVDETEGWAALDFLRDASD